MSGVEAKALVLRAFTVPNFVMVDWREESRPEGSAQAMTPRDCQATAKLCATYERQQRALETLEWWATKGDWQSLVARLKTRELIPNTKAVRS